MNRKLSALFLCVVLMMLAVSSDAFAQNYGVQNNSPVAITVYIHGTCPGPPPFAWIIGPVVVPPGGAVIIPIPPPPCVVTGIDVNGSLYPVGYSGPIAPPNPPNLIRVGARRTMVQ